MSSSQPLDQEFLRQPDGNGGRRFAQERVIAHKTVRPYVDEFRTALIEMSAAAWDGGHTVRLPGEGRFHPFAAPSKGGDVDLHHSVIAPNARAATARSSC